MRPLSILFTNNTLSDRAGSELWVRDVCSALVGRGHRPIAFSLVLGAIADDLRTATVPVVSSLDKVGIVPDVIHGHHHVETLMAALHFPGVPIVHVCHGFLPWEEAPLHHPSIARYVAVDATCVDRLTVEEGIAPERIERLLNFVDVRRFAPRPPLPSRPARALVLSNQAEPGGYVEIIRAACQQSGIELEVAGVRWGRVIDRPEDVLAGVDLVFAKGRTALEAMAVGCAVVVTDIFGAGPLVTWDALERMRSCNFGIRLLREPHTVDWYRSQIAAYDAADAGRISAWVRQDAGLEQAVDHLLAIYERAIADGRERRALDVTDLEAHRAAGRHVSAIAGRIKQAYGLERTVRSVSTELATAHSRNQQLTAERGALVQQVAGHQAIADTVQAVSSELASARRLNQRLGEERQELARQVTGLQARDRASQLVSAELATVRSLNQRLTREHGQMAQQIASYQGLERTVQSLSAELTTARERHQRVVADRDHLRLLVGEYQGLSVIRLRDAVIRIPLLGGIARRTVRWLQGSSAPGGR